MFTKLVIGLAAIMLIGAGCSTQQPTAPSVDQSVNSSAATGTDNATVTDNMATDNADVAAKFNGGDHDGDDFGRGYGHGHAHRQVTFKVRIENVSTGMTLHLSNGETAPAPNSPGVWTITRLFNPLFSVGRYDRGQGLEAQAEDGDPTMLAASMASNPYVKSTGVFAIPIGDSSPGPATPGKAFEFTVTASPGDRLSLTSMFGQSNDLFYAPGTVGIPLFRGWRPVNGDVTRYFRLWDAGTEVNQEPGLGPDQAPRQAAPNTGQSEHKRILPVHDQYTYPPTNQVIKVTIMPMGDAS